MRTEIVLCNHCDNSHSMDFEVIPWSMEFVSISDDFELIYSRKPALLDNCAFERVPSQVSYVGVCPHVHVEEMPLVWMWENSEGNQQYSAGISDTLDGPIRKHIHDGMLEIGGYIRDGANFSDSEIKNMSDDTVDLVIAHCKRFV